MSGYSAVCGTISPANVTMDCPLNWRGGWSFEVRQYTGFNARHSRQVPGPERMRSERLRTRIVLPTYSGSRPIRRPAQATRLKLVVNLKTAKALGLSIPQSVLLRADEVIQ
jgi:hypothetical protein